MDTAAVDAWDTFFAAQLGAAAALAGLIFVGLSLNLAKILAAPSLPNRALLSMLVLLGILLVASFMLMPGQSLATVGWEAAITGAFFVVFGTIIEVYTLVRLNVHNRAGFIGNMILLELAFIPYVIGGIMMIGGNAQGIVWISAGVMVAFVKALGDAWVLLVEINR